MKKLLFLAAVMSCLSSFSQSYDIAGEYERKSKAGQILLQLNLNGAFQFHSYTTGLQSNFPHEPSTSGRGTWIVENDIIYFATDLEIDKNHNFTLNFNQTKAKFTPESVKGSADEKAPAKLEFLESGIFWVNGIELKNRNK